MWWFPIGGLSHVIISQHVNCEETLERLCQIPTQKSEGDFPGSAVVKISPSNAGDASWIPVEGAKIPCAPWPENQNVKQKQYYNKFNKDFKKVSEAHKLPLFNFGGYCTDLGTNQVQTLRIYWLWGQSPATGLQQPALSTGVKPQSV